jgi:hypothetical protein
MTQSSPGAVCSLNSFLFYCFYEASLPRQFSFPPERMYFRCALPGQICLVNVTVLQGLSAERQIIVQRHNLYIKRNLESIPKANNKPNSGNNLLFNYLTIYV